MPITDSSVEQKDASGVTIDLGTRYDSDAGIHFQKVVPVNEDGSPWDGGGSGLEGDALANLDDDYPSGTVDLTGETAVSSWVIGNFTGGTAVAVDFPAVDQPFEVTLTSLDASDLDLAVDGSAVSFSRTVDPSEYLSEQVHVTVKPTPFGWVAVVHPPTPAQFQPYDATGNVVLTTTDVQSALDQADAALAGSLGYVNHGATAGTARPTGYAAVHWVGTVEPSNAVAGDIVDIVP